MDEAVYSLRHLTRDEGMIVIESVVDGSPAEKAGLKKGDKIISVNDNLVTDGVEFVFYSQGENAIKLDVMVGRRKKKIELKRERGEGWGIEPEPLKIKECTNKCIFCFCDQTPDDLRESLYIKDDDYRLSFLNGNFITLTNLRPAELKRILDIHLSPLYISVHSTDTELRRKLLGRKRIPDIVEQMRTLGDGGVKLHTQVVLIPGLNDGEHLLRTLNDLYEMKDFVRSVAVIPVGLTRYRAHLPKIPPVGKDYALDFVNWHYELRRQTPELRRFFYIADEFFLKADYPIPPRPYYGDFPQIENGIGMVRRFIDAMNSISPRSAGKNSHKRRVHLVTGEMFAPFLWKYLPPRLPRVDVAVHPVMNHFWGRSVTVGNLLTGGDIAETLRGVPAGEPVVLPPRVVNEDWLFLDGYHLNALSNEVDTDVYLAPEEPSKLVSFINDIISR